MRCTLTIVFGLIPVLAAAQSGQPPVKRSNPPTMFKAPGQTNLVEVAGPVKIIYIAGQIANNKDGILVGTDMKTQAEQVFKNIEAALTAAGAKFSDVVKTTTMVTDIAQMQTIRDTRDRYFGDTPPANTIMQVVHLIRPEAVIEIEAVAVVPVR
jgi:2-iminobutanoate/2-iminopropanoate deaminase